MMRLPTGWADFIQRLFFDIPLGARNTVPMSSPMEALNTASGSLLRAMTIMQPASLHISAASSLVLIPPVPTPETASPAMWRTASRSSTTGTRTASGSDVGSLSYRPATSERIIRRSASVLLATIAERVSLSPNLIS